MYIRNFIRPMKKKIGKSLGKPILGRTADIPLTCSEISPFYIQTQLLMLYKYHKVILTFLKLDKRKLALI